MKRPPLISVLTIVLALVFAAGWLREHKLLEKLVLENSRLSLELEKLGENKAGVGAGVHEPMQFSEQTDNAHSKTSDSVKHQPRLPESDSSVTNRLVESTPAVTTAITSVDAYENQVTSIVPKNAEPPSYTDLQLEIYRCSTHMLEINMATERWAANHNGVMPQSLADLSGYLAPMLLVCPGTRPVSLSVTWEGFDPMDITYRINSSGQGARWDFQNPNERGVVSIGWLRCPIHKTTALNRVMPSSIPSDQVFRPDLR